MTVQNNNTGKLVKGQYVPIQNDLEKGCVVKGDIIEYISTVDGSFLQAEVIRINPKTVKIKTEMGYNCNIHYGFFNIIKQ